MKADSKEKNLRGKGLLRVPAQIISREICVYGIADQKLSISKKKGQHSNVLEKLTHVRTEISKRN